MTDSIHGERQWHPRPILPRRQEQLASGGGPLHALTSTISASSVPGEAPKGRAAGLSTRREARAPPGSLALAASAPEGQPVRLAACKRRQQHQGRGADRLHWLCAARWKMAAKNGSISWKGARQRARWGGGEPQGKAPVPSAEELAVGGGAAGEHLVG